jgi:transketolase
VIVVGVGGGLSYASLGYTHHAVEDIGMMRLLPNMTVLCPGDSLEVTAALRAAHAHDGPVFIRLGKKGEPAVHSTMPDLQIGKGLVVREGGDVCLLGVGTTLPTVMVAADKLAAKGISAKVVSFHTVKPLDEELLSEAFDRYCVVAVIEEHSRIGGAGAAVAEWRADNPDGRGRLVRIALPDRIFHKSGSEDYARECLGLTPEAITERISQAISSGSR